MHHAPETIVRHLRKRETQEAVPEKDRNFCREDCHADIDQQHNGCEAGEQSDYQERAANDFASTKIRTRKVAAGAFVRKRRRIITLDLRRKLGEVVNAESLLDSSYLVHHLFKSVLAEELVFFLLEIFA